MQQRRGIAARAGLVALNVLTPGLGLLRLRRPRSAFAFWLVLPVSLAIVGLLWVVTNPLPFGLLMLSAGVPVAAWLGSLLGAAWSSWSSSRFKSPPPPPVWARWYAIVAAYLVGGLGLSFAVTDGLHRLYKPFYLPSEAMAPTLLKNDRIVASMRQPRSLQRGDVILVETRDGLYIKRVAGLPGDRIALHGGIVVINGRRVAQRLVREDVVENDWGRGGFRRIVERFPGEALPHEIYDMGYTEIDDFPETLVKPGHVFVLGDNRDRSADSRVSRDLHGVEQVPVSDIRGKALYYTWGPSRRTGELISR